MLISKKIEQEIASMPDGNFIFISDFVADYEYEVVKKVLQRLCKKEKIIRLTRGIYYKPKRDKLFGLIKPNAEQIAEAIAKRDKARIIPTGSYALYKLGLSSQIPMNVVYLTDGSPRKIQVGKQKITLKKTSTKNLAVEHRLSSLIIQGLKELGKDGIEENDIKKLQDIIDKSGEHQKIRQNMALAPEWIQKIVNPLIQKHNNE